jgi:hypothetical protein
MIVAHKKVEERHHGQRWRLSIPAIVTTFLVVQIPVWLIEDLVPDGVIKDIMVLSPFGAVILVWCLGNWPRSPH